MFGSIDDVNIDEDFLSDAFDIPSTNINNESIKRSSDSPNEQPVKKIAIESSATKNILSIINSQPKLDDSKDVSCSKFKFSENRVTVENNRMNQERRRVVQRKFPGPAGILPEQKQLSISIKTEEFDTSASNKTLETDEIVCSQLSENIFKSGPWQKMLADWSAIYKGICLPNKYTISWTKSKAICKKLIENRTPFVAAVIQTIDCSSEQPMVSLKDESGDIQAILLREVWKEYCDYLNPGSVIVLKQVGVLSPLKKHYLSITLNNIVTIYTEIENEEAGKTVETTNIQNMNVEEFVEAIKSTKQSFESQKIIQKLNPPVNNPYFKRPMNVPKPLDISVNKQIIRSEIKNIRVLNESNLNQPEHKFGFKAKINTARTYAISSEDSNQSSSEENIIISQMLDGVDTSSLFEDF